MDLDAEKRRIRRAVTARRRDIGSADAADAAERICRALFETFEFEAGQRAFYYARVLENPVCRWSTMLCNELGVDCNDIDNVPADFIECCSPVIEDQRVIKERAWSSPIWYRPETL